jgi:hypothetical protein
MLIFSSAEFIVTVNLLNVMYRDHLAKVPLYVTMVSILLLLHGTEPNDALFNAVL